MSSEALPLAGAVVLLAADHYDKQISGILQEIAQRLGAQITERREDSTMLIINVNSPKWETEREHLRYLQEKFPHQPRPEIRSYHWLIACGKEGRLLDDSELQYPEPFMVDPTRERYPLKVWVSKNVTRLSDETPEEALANVTSQLEAAGAITVSKRKHADVLVVDITSEFYKKVVAERDGAGRQWQRIAQREWVDFCLKDQVVELRNRREEEMEDPGEDSFVEEEPAPVRSGPGRPTGKPRIDYSPSDTDFLCRWLAAFYPSGSWLSRKTYHTLVGDHEAYPIVARHSSQSWHEHFKKQSNSLSSRVRRFVAGGIGADLLTREERHAEHEKKAREKAEQAEPEGYIEASIAGPSRGSPVPPAPVLIDERDISPSPSASDSRNAPGQPYNASEASSVVENVTKDTDAVESETRATLVSQALDVLVPETALSASSSKLESATNDASAPDETARSSVQVEASSLSVSTNHPAVEPVSEDIAPPEPTNPEQVAGTSRPTESIESERVLVEETVVEHVAIERTAADETITQTETQRTIGETVEFLVPETIIRPTAPIEEGSVTGRPHKQADEAVNEQPVASSSKPARSTKAAHEVDSAPAGSSKTPARSGSAATRQNEGLASSSAALVTPSPARTDRKRASDRAEGSTPLREELQRSREKRQRTAERLAQREGQGGSTNRLSKRAQSPDKVYQFIKVPPRRPDPALAAQAAASPARARTPPRQLTPAEWQESVVRGQQISTDLASEYRNRVIRLTQKYKITPGDIAAASNEIRKQTGAPADWKTLEAVLAKRHMN